MKKENDFISNHYDSEPTALDDAVGGNYREWKLEIERLSKRSINGNIPKVGDVMGEIIYALKHIKRTDFPIFLDPKNAGFIQVAQHGKIRQYLSDSTIIKNIRYARFMEMHDCPVDFRNLTPESVLKHFDYRLEVENATPVALAHEKKAIRMFLRAYGLKKEELDLWAQVLKTPPVVIDDDVNFVYPNDVHKFYTYEGYSKKRKYKLRVYENKLFQHIAFMGFNFGMRCPSEIVVLTLDDVIIKKNGHGHLIITEVKKRGKRRRTIPYSKKVLSSKVYKSPLNYLKNWRPKVENEESGDAFFLMPDGKPITNKYVRGHLSPCGKKITKDPKFKPYDMRHTFGTYYYQLTKDLKKTSKKLGHTKTVNTDKYVAIAEDLEKQYDGKNLFNIALKPQNYGHVGGKQNKQVTLNYAKNRPQSKVFSPVGSSGLSRTHDFLQKGLLGVESRFYTQLKVQFYSLKSFFFLFYTSMYNFVHFLDSTILLLVDKRHIL